MATTENGTVLGNGSSDPYSGLWEDGRSTENADHVGAIVTFSQRAPDGGRA